MKRKWQKQTEMILYPSPKKGTQMTRILQISTDRKKNEQNLVSKPQLGYKRMNLTRDVMFLVPMLFNLLNLIIYTGLRWNVIMGRSCVERLVSFSRGA